MTVKLGLAVFEYGIRYVFLSSERQPRCSQCMESNFLASLYPTWWSEIAISSNLTQPHFHLLSQTSMRLLALLSSRRPICILGAGLWQNDLKGSSFSRGIILHPPTQAYERFMVGEEGCNIQIFLMSSKMPYKQERKKKYPWTQFCGMTTEFSRNDE